MPIFDLNDFNYRKVTKLAPDAFITINGAFGGRVLSPVNSGDTQDINIQGGIVSISVNAAVAPAGAGKANIQIIAPEYTGLHSKSSSSNSGGYWVTLPSGAKVSYFLPMMELCVFMKGRFLNGPKAEPTYYRVFWGFITDVSEDYNDGTFRISLQCNDMLGWWKYQTLMVSPDEFASVFNGPTIEAFSTIFKNKNPWQIIIQLLYETQWQSSNPKSTYSFLSTKYSNIFLKPEFGNFNADMIGTLATKMAEYWNKRFNFFGESMAIEMFGLTKKVGVTQNISDNQHTSVDANSTTILKSTPVKEGGVVNQRYIELTNADVKLDYNLLARVTPYAAYDLFGAGGQSLELSKLEIAQKVCESTHMEFYVDTNGIIVFKPPFYNLDVTKGDLPYYVIEADEVINHSASTNTDHICNYMRVTAPMLQVIPKEIEIAGLHIDWESMLRYGIRFHQSYVSYGNDAKSLSLIAAGEMARINAEANTGHVTIPLRPEMRLGYPIYLAPKDVYYYVAGITHSFSFGSSATTELSLMAKRDRIYDVTGEYSEFIKLSDTKSANEQPPADGPVKGLVMRGFVQRFLEKSEEDKITITSPEKVLGPSKYTQSADKQVAEYVVPGTVSTETEQEAFLRVTGAKAGSKFNGVYKIVPAELTTSLDATAQNQPTSSATGEISTVMSNQILMITDKTVPYTDIRGYRHIGAFPYGANLILKKGGLATDDNVKDKAVITTEKTVADPHDTPQKMSTTPQKKVSQPDAVPKTDKSLSTADITAATTLGYNLKAVPQLTYNALMLNYRVKNYVQPQNPADATSNYSTNRVSLKKNIVPSKPKNIIIDTWKK